MLVSKARRFAFGPLILAALLTGSPARAQAGAAADAFAAFANRNNTTVYVAGSTMMRVVGEIRPAGCSLDVRKTIETGGEVTREEMALNLANATPTIRLETSRRSANTSIYIETSSGSEDFTLLRHNPGESTPRRIPASWVEFPFPDSAVAARAMALAAAAVRECGGTPRTQAANAEATAQHERASGTDEESMRLRTQCERLVRGQLVSGDDATFPSDGIVVLRNEERGTISITGDVVGVNRLGGRVRNTYLCDFERSGDSWIPKGRPILF